MTRNHNMMDDSTMREVVKGLVKPLEWDDRVKKEYPIRFITNSTCGRYQITEWIDGSGNLIHFMGKFGKNQRVNDAPTTSGGSGRLKAAAQADYEARILADLDLGKVQALIAASVARERESCAQIVQAMAHQDNTMNSYGAAHVAAAIRARGNGAGNE